MLEKRVSGNWGAMPNAYAGMAPFFLSHRERTASAASQVRALAETTTIQPHHPSPQPYSPAMPHQFNMPTQAWAWHPKRHGTRLRINPRLFRNYFHQFSANRLQVGGAERPAFLGETDQKSKVAEPVDFSGNAVGERVQSLQGVGLED